MRWRDNTRATELEEIFAKHKRVALLKEPLAPSSIVEPLALEPSRWRAPDISKTLVLRQGPEIRVIGGKLYASIGWIARNLAYGVQWRSLRRFIVQSDSIGRVRISASLGMYDVADIAMALSVAQKTQTKAQLRPNVSRVLQGSRSINEALLAFVQDSAECRGNER